MPISITDASILELGAYQEADALVFGIKLAERVPFETLIFQIETDSSPQRDDRWGMYVEVDGKGAYGSASNFDFDPIAKLLKVLIRPSEQDSSIELSIDARRLSAGELEILTRMTQEYRNYHTC